MNIKKWAVAVFVLLCIPAVSFGATFNRPLIQGSSGADVTALQQYLVEKGYLHTTPSGYFGNLTRIALAAFQKANNLEPLGGVGPKTRTLLNSLVSISASGATGNTATASTPAPSGAALAHTLAPGASGADVTALQNFLAAQGLFTGTPTGYYGSVTAQAVAAFQAAHSLEKVGAVGPKTLMLINQLMTSVASSGSSGSTGSTSGGSSHNSGGTSGGGGRSGSGVAIQNFTPAPSSGGGSGSGGGGGGSTSPTPTPTPAPTPAGDTTSPSVTITAPTSNLLAGVTQTTLFVTTNEAATCRYSTNSTFSFASGVVFTTTGNTSHSVPLTSLTNGTSYTYFVKCSDSAGNISGNASVNFSVASPTPVTPVTPTPSVSTNITNVRYIPRSMFATRMVGGLIQGSNTSATAGFVTLATISVAPAEGGWTTLPVTAGTSYRYLRYLSPNGGYGNVSEIEFYNGSTKLIGTTFGSAGSWSNMGNDFSKAFDGDTSSFFDGAVSDAQYVGIDTGSAPVTPTPTPTPAPTGAAAIGCVTGAAFCDTFNTPSVRGRGGDLNPAIWSAARWSGEILSSGQGVANPVRAAQIPQCRAGVSTLVFPPNDTLICDSSSGHAGQLLTGVAMQNYGANSYMVRQPFDFAGRTGKIAFDYDGPLVGLGGIPEIQITEDPSPATTFREYSNWETGQIPRNGISIKFISGGSCGSTGAYPTNVMVYSNYVGTIITPTFDHTNGCAKVSPGSMTHFEVQLSQNRVDVYGSDASTNGGQSFSNVKLIYSANISLPFTRGYVHFNARNHASEKYGASNGFDPNIVMRWDNLSFDGPVIAAPRAYEIADNTTMSTYNGVQFQNLGWTLSDGSGKAAGMYDPTSKVSALTFQNVDKSGTTAATLTFDMFYGRPGTPSTSWGVSYRFNGGTWRTVTLTAAQLASFTNNTTDSQEFLAHAISVPLTDIVQGNNTIEFLPVGGLPMNYPPVVTNIDLLLSTNGTVTQTPSDTTAPTVSITAPTGQLAANTTQTTLNVTTNENATCAWSASAGSAFSSMNAFATTGGTSHSAALSGLVNGTSYSRFVKCMDASGNISADSTVSFSVAAATPAPAPSPVAGNCGILLGSTATFCDTFSTTNPGIASRTGDLDPAVWGVSRLGQNVNLGQQTMNLWPPTKILGCSGTATVLTPNDVVICNGQLREASNDNLAGTPDGGVVTVLAMYPKQPFDWAGRTGTVAFDVSNDTHGSHSAWPEFWITDLPIPAPINNDSGAMHSNPQNGFGIRLENPAPPGQYGSCPNGNNLDKKRWTLGSAVVIRNYVQEDIFYGTNRTAMNVQALDCVTAPADNSGVMNHVEVRVSQNQIDVYATDAGVAPTAQNLKHIGVITNANLTLTRGLVWIEDVHYNADKAEPVVNGEPDVTLSQRQHTFVWDNVAFDGPFTYRDFSYDALDNTVPGTLGTVNLGKVAAANQTATWNVLNMPANRQAAVVRALFNFYTYDHPNTINVIVNGHAHQVAWPYPDAAGFIWRTLGVTIPITDLVTGTNVLQIGSDMEMVTSNVNIVLVNVPNGVPVLPGSVNTYPN